MMPAEPSAENFDEGLSITSMRSMLSAGNCCRMLARLSAVSPEDLPLIHTSTLELPRKEMFPSLSTSTLGMFSNTSDATPPAFAICWSTLKVLRSTSSFMSERCAVTTTSPSDLASSAM